jgi:hypothetical protein
LIMISQTQLKDHCQNKDTDFRIDFVGIGTGKAGTTWISEMLDAHPDICMSEPKEVHYFNKRGSYFLNTENSNYNKGFQWYKNHFRHCRYGQLIGEFSPKYFFDLQAPERIKQTFPDVKLIVCLRDPVDRAFSQYNFVTHYMKKEIRSFEEVIRTEPEYVEKGLYCKHLERYFQYFGKNQVHIIWFEEIKNHPDEALKKLFQFLGVDETFNPLNLNKKINSARQSRFHQIPQLMDKVTSLLTQYRLSFVIKAVKKTGVNTFIKKANTQKIEFSPMPDEARRCLRQQFAEDIAGLEKLLTKDLSHWK